MGQSERDKKMEDGKAKRDTMCDCRGRTQLVGVFTISFCLGQVCAFMSVCVRACQRVQSRALDKPCPCVALAPINPHNHNIPLSLRHTKPRQLGLAYTELQQKNIHRLEGSMRSHGTGHTVPPRSEQNIQMLHCILQHRNLKYSLRWLSHTLSFHTPTRMARRSAYPICKYDTSLSGSDQSISQQLCSSYPGRQTKRDLLYTHSWCIPHLQ